MGWCMKDVKSRVHQSKSMNTLYCGLDVHKESTYATIINVFGEVQTQKRMSNEEVPGFLEPFKVEKVAMEASTYIMPLYRRLSGDGYDVTVCHPKRTKMIAESRIKNDKVDSKALAELLRLDALPVSYIPPRDIAVLREKVRRRAFMVRQVTKLKVKTRGRVGLRGSQAAGETWVVHEGGGGVAEDAGAGVCGLLPPAYGAF